MAYLCFSLSTIPDLSLNKYSSLDERGVDGVLKKTHNFLRQLNRKGILSQVFFHLLYIYKPNPQKKGRQLHVIFIASGDKNSLLHTRELIQNSALSTFYDIVSNERVSITDISRDKQGNLVVSLCNHLGHVGEYYVSNEKAALQAKTLQKVEKLTNYSNKQFLVKIKNGSLLTLNEDDYSFESGLSVPDSDHKDGYVSESGLLIDDSKYDYVAALGKREFFDEPSVTMSDDNQLKYYKVAEWGMNDNARLINMFKLMQGLNKPVTFRIDIFPVDYTERLRKVLPIQELRRRTSMQFIKGVSAITTSRDENAEDTLKQYNKLIERYESTPHFRANILAFSDSKEIGELIVDAAGAEALTSGNYRVKVFASQELNESKFTAYSKMDRPLDIAEKDAVNHLKFMPNLYLLDELRPFFTFPALHDGESIEIPKETAPSQNETGLVLGVDENGYNVVLPIDLLKKHAFLAGVPGSGKTNSMLYLASELWKICGIPFLIFEPAKKEYRALANTNGMDDLLIFSPSSGTNFPLHINPFEFPYGMSLSEHIGNLLSVFEGAFTIDGPAPFLIDSAIDAIYRKKGWYPDTINKEGLNLQYPTMSELYTKLTEEVEKAGYEGEIRSNLKSFLQVRVGSLLRREMGDVFDVPKSTLMPEEWLKRPALIELESMSIGPANFLTLLLATLIRESLKVAPSNDLRHVIFFEEAHNLIGPQAVEAKGQDADPKLAATAYIVKMLAEVRALGEGIIIADQLPTIMAPEVIKNTGLKIGHKLTAEDDRNLLGGTMSTNATQLEQMATFNPGEALVTFEGLLRPFKVMIKLWENGKSFETPTNEELVHVMSEKTGYKYLLDNSAKICCEKFSTEIDKINRESTAFIVETKKWRASMEEIKKVIDNFSDDEFYDNTSKNPSIIQSRKMLASGWERKEFLEIRVNKIFITLRELLVKLKCYLFQNPGHRKDTIVLLLRLSDIRNNLFNSVHNYYSINSYEHFSNEMKQWKLGKIMGDVDFNF
ncbi:MAG: hypothetical protein LBH62_05250 [Nitrososphaerota archaeon]|jgi:hypothetical protein|nr:hypothetical protein [Nitrososphaerota archaeon]